MDLEARRATEERKETEVLLVQREILVPSQAHEEGHVERRECLEKRE